MTNFKLSGWIPDPKDRIDSAKPFDLIKSSLDTSGSGNVDLSPFSSPRHNQRQTNSCCAQSLIKALEIKRIMKYGIDKHIPLSVLDLYWGARDFMYPKQTDKDSGTHISLACEVLRDFGVCREKIFPFVESQIFTAPPIMASREARLNRIYSHFRLTSEGNNLLDDIILNLRNGNPIVFGTIVGDNWTNYPGGDSVISKCLYPEGRHAICIVGFVDGNFKIENSWGNDWGNDGFCLVAPEVIADKNASQDFWVIVSGTEGWFEK